MENLRKYFKGELSTKSEDLLAPSPELLRSCCVGNYMDPDEDVSQVRIHVYKRANCITYHSMIPFVFF